MTETLSHPQGAESQESQEGELQALIERLQQATKAVEDIQEQNKDRISGMSSFNDVTRNLLATIGPDLRAYQEDGDPEDLEGAQEALQALEVYLAALDNPDTLEGELTQAGANPQLRAEADAQAGSAIQRYAHGLAGEQTEGTGEESAP